MTVFEAYITNLGKYAEGQLVGETLKFPATTEEVQSLLKNIGVDGVRYEEFFITAFDGDVMGLYDYLTEYENLDELNQRRKVKDFFIKSKKKSHFADFLTEQTLDFVLHRLLGGLAEMDTDDIGGLADLLSDSRASGGVGCGIVHSKSSCK